VAVRIRLKRLGRRHLSHWRICATDKHTARDGRVIEELGSYNPSAPNDRKITIHRDRVSHWLRAGAVPSDTVAQLLAHAGLDRKGNEVTPRPWKKKKAPPPPAAQKAQEAKAEEPKAEKPAEEKKAEEV
jgi:small subunit ribosomal protein S16